jgi:hypothetical protein
MASSIITIIIIYYYYYYYKIIIEYIREVKSRQARLGGQMDGMEDTGCAYTVFAVKPEGKRPL